LEDKVSENKSKNRFSSPLTFVILLGVVSLFSDVTYEGARSLNGQFLGYLGATAAVVGIVAGFGELIGYALRLLTGYLSDRTKRYWTFTIVGYLINLLAVPLLAFAGNWIVAAGLIILERIGKSIRTPSRDVMLSYAGSQLGSGWAFGLHEAMDQIGATLGPLLISLTLLLKGGFKASYGFLAIPALLAILSLFIARVSFPEPKDLAKKEEKLEFRGFDKSFYIYITSICFVAMGYADFPLIAFHLDKHAIVNPGLIPVFYSIAMVTDALSAMLFGKLFDKHGVLIIAIALFLSMFFAPLVFLFNFTFALLGMILWGIGMGVQESIMRAQISKLIQPEKRGSAFGIFNTFYGFSWFLGSALIGVLYGISLYFVVLFSIICQLIAVLSIIFFVKRRK
jgi:MFS family permease